MLGLVARRARGMKRAPVALRRRAALEVARERVIEALSHRSDEERAVLAMMLIERLTAAEAAQVLGMDVTELLATQRALLRMLRRAFKGELRPSRYGESAGRIVTPAREKRA